MDSFVGGWIRFFGRRFQLRRVTRQHPGYCWVSNLYCLFIEKTHPLKFKYVSASLPDVADEDDDIHSFKGSHYFVPDSFLPSRFECLASFRSTDRR